MTPLNEVAIAASISALSSANNLDEIAAGAYSLAIGMGLERYTIVELRRGITSRIFQNAPAELVDQANEAIATDSLITQARTSPRPFVWEAEGGTWRDRNGAAGYRGGVAGASQDAERSGCIVLISCAEAVADETAPVLMTYALSAAICIAGALRRLAPDACPLSQRELDCLLHTLAGRSARETAHALGVGARTVEQYLARAREKLEATSSHAAATLALRRGWLDLQHALELSDLVATSRAG